jgi:hypothetical protein
VCKKEKKKKIKGTPEKSSWHEIPRRLTTLALPLRPILGWPVFLPQPLAGARIKEKRRRPNHVT